MVAAMDTTTNSMKFKVDMECECVDCRGTFVVTGKELAYFEAQKLQMPRRCKKCRTVKKKLDFLENMEIRNLIETMKTQEANSIKLLMPTIRVSVIEAFEGLSDINKNLLYHNWQLIRKAYIEQDISLAGKLPNSWPMLELYVHDREMYMAERNKK